MCLAVVGCAAWVDASSSNLVRIDAWTLRRDRSPSLVLAPVVGLLVGAGLAPLGWLRTPIVVLLGMVVLPASVADVVLLYPLIVGAAVFVQACGRMCPVPPWHPVRADYDEGAGANTE